MMKKITSQLIFAGALWTSAVGLAHAEDPYYGLQMEEFEYRATDSGGDLFVWNGDAFYGTDELKIRLESNGEYNFNESALETLTNQITLQTPISDFWDIKGGLRLDSPKGTNRGYAVVGLTGLAPQWFEVDTDLYLSEEGNLSMSLDIEYELLLTNYLILTPSAEFDGAFSSDREIGSGSGLNSAELGLRLSYDVWDRTLSPYVGVVYERKFGQTANWAKDEGEEISSWQFVIGTKFLF